MSKKDKALHTKQKHSKQKLISSLVLSGFLMSLGASLAVKFSNNRNQALPNKTTINTQQGTSNGTINLYATNNVIYATQTSNFPILYANDPVISANESKETLAKSSNVLKASANSLQNLTYYWYLGQTLINTTTTPTFTINHLVIAQINANGSYLFSVVAKNKDTVLNSNSVKIKILQAPNLTSKPSFSYYLNNTGTKINQDQLSTFYVGQNQDIQYLEAGAITNKDYIDANYQWFVSFTSYTSNNGTSFVSMGQDFNSNTLALNKATISKAQSILKLPADSSSFGYYNFYCTLSAKMSNGTVYVPKDTKTWSVLYTNLSSLALSSNITNSISIINTNNQPETIAPYSQDGLINDGDSLTQSPAITANLASPVHSDTGTSPQITYAWQEVKKVVLANGNITYEVVANIPNSAITTTSNASLLNYDSTYFNSLFSQAGNYYFRCKIEASFLGASTPSVYSPVFSINIANPTITIGAKTQNIYILQNTTNQNLPDNATLTPNFAISGITNKADYSIFASWKIIKNNDEATAVIIPSSSANFDLDYAGYVNSKAPATYTFIETITYNWFNEPSSSVVFTFNVQILATPEISTSFSNEASNWIIGQKTGKLPTVSAVANISYSNELNWTKNVSWNLKNGNTVISNGNTNNLTGNSTYSGFASGGVNNLNLTFDFASNDIAKYINNLTTTSILALTINYTYAIQGQTFNKTITYTLNCYPLATFNAVLETPSTQTGFLNKNTSNTMVLNNGIKNTTIVLQYNNLTSQGQDYYNNDSGIVFSYEWKLNNTLLDPNNTSNANYYNTTQQTSTINANTILSQIQQSGTYLLSCVITYSVAGLSKQVANVPVTTINVLNVPTVTLDTSTIKTTPGWNDNVLELFYGYSGAGESNWNTSTNDFNLLNTQAETINPTITVNGLQTGAVLSYGTLAQKGGKQINGVSVQPNISNYAEATWNSAITINNNALVQIATSNNVTFNKFLNTEKEPYNYTGYYVKTEYKGITVVQFVHNVVSQNVFYYVDDTLFTEGNATNSFNLSFKTKLFVSMQLSNLKIKITLNNSTQNIVNSKVFTQKIFNNLIITRKYYSSMRPNGVHSHYTLWTHPLSRSVYYTYSRANWSSLLQKVRIWSGGNVMPSNSYASIWINSNAAPRINKVWYLDKTITNNIIWSMGFILNSHILNTQYIIHLKLPDMYSVIEKIHYASIRF